MKAVVVFAQLGRTPLLPLLPSRIAPHPDVERANSRRYHRRVYVVRPVPGQGGPDELSREQLRVIIDGGEGQRALETASRALALAFRTWMFLPLWGEDLAENWETPAQRPGSTYRGLMRSNGQRLHDPGSAIQEWARARLVSVFRTSSIGRGTERLRDSGTPPASEGGRGQDVMGWRTQPSRGAPGEINFNPCGEVSIAGGVCQMQLNYWDGAALWEHVGRSYLQRALPTEAPPSFGPIGVALYEWAAAHIQMTPELGDVSTELQRTRFSVWLGSKLTSLVSAGISEIFTAARSGDQPAANPDDDTNSRVVSQFVPPTLTTHGLGGLEPDNVDLLGEELLALDIPTNPRCVPGREPSPMGQVAAVMARRDEGGFLVMYFGPRGRSLTFVVPKGAVEELAPSVHYIAFGRVEVWTSEDCTRLRWFQPSDSSSDDDLIWEIVGELLAMELWAGLSGENTLSGGVSLVNFFRRLEVLVDYVRVKGWAALPGALVRRPYETCEHRESIPPWEVKIGGLEGVMVAAPGGGYRFIKE